MRTKFPPFSSGVCSGADHLTRDLEYLKAQGTRSARTSLEVRCNRRAAAGKRLEDRNLLKQMAFAGMLECCVKGDGPPARREVRTWRGSYWAAWDQACVAGITGAEAGHGLPVTDWGGTESVLRSALFLEPPPPGAVLEQR